MTNRKTTTLEIGIAITMLATGLPEVVITRDHEHDLLNYTLYKKTMGNGDVRLRLERNK